MILHGFMLQNIYTTVFRVERLNNRTRGIKITKSEGVFIWYLRFYYNDLSSEF